MGWFCLSADSKQLFLKTLRFGFLIYYVASLSFRYCFLMPGFDAYRYESVVIFDYLADAFYLFDIFTQFRSHVIVPTEMANTAKQRRYSTLRIVQMVNGVEMKKATKWGILRSNLGSVVNIASIFPMELFGYLAGIEGYYYLRIIRLVKLKDYFFYWRNICDGLQHINFAGSNYGVKRVLLLIISSALIGHVASCLFYRIAYNAMLSGSREAWIYYDGLADLNAEGGVVFLTSLDFRYLRALYWSVQTLNTVGFGDIVAKSEAETWFCILFFYTSAFMVYYSIANLMEVMTNFDSARTEALIRQSRFEQYATYRRLPRELVQRVRSYFNHQWKLLKGIDERQVYGLLPPDVSQQIKQYLVRDLLVRVGALSELNKGLLNSLSDNIDSYVYNPDDVIVQKESRVAGMYIIATGEVQVIRFGGETTSLRTKQYFGLASLVKSYSSSTTYIARSFCEILFLKGTIFRHVSKSYMTKPEFDAFVKKNLRSYYEQEKETRKISDTEALAERKSSRQMDFIMKTIQNANFPDSEVRLMWDSILFIGLVFYFTSIPLLLAVMLRDNFLESTLVILCFGFLTDALFIVDFLLQCAIFGYWQDGVVCLDRSKVWKHFWTQNPPLLIFLEVFPLDLALGLSCSMEFYCIFRLLKLLHSRRLSYFAEKFLQTFVSYTGIGVSFEMSRFIALYFMLFQICHWAGCTWRLVADVGTQVFHYEVTWLSVDKHALDYKSMAVVEYARSLYWAASALSSIGYPDILPRNHVEVAVIIVIIFFGYFMFNTCLGAIGNLFSSFNREKREFTMKVERIRQVLKHNKIPSSIETRVINYFDHLWARYNGVNEEELLNDLPPTLRGAVVRFVIGPLLTSIPFFAHCSEPMENLLLSMVESRCFLDGDPLMVAGELGKEMFVIETGTVIVTSKDKSVTFATLGPGNYVGESCLLEVSERTASVYAIGYVDTYVISNESFFRAAEKFPDEYDDIVNEIQEIIEEKKRMNEKRKKEAEERTPIASPPSSNNGAVSDVSSISKQVDKSEKHRLKEEIQVEREQVDNSSEPRLATVVEPLENTPHSRPASWHYWLTHMCSRCSKSLVFIKPLHPDSKYKHNWEIIMFSICIYYAIVIPLRLAFTLPSWLFWIDYLFDLVNLFDCYLAATSLGEYHAGQVLMTADGIFRRYYRTRFLVDVFLILPYDLLALLHFVLPPKIHMFLRAILRFPKLAKLWYLSQYYMRVEKACIDSNINYTTVRVVSITTAVIIIGHWVACGWMMTASYNFVGSCSTSADYLNCQYLGTWVEQQYLSGKLPKDGGDDWSRYIRSINWAIPTLTSEIIGDIFPFNTNESLFTFIVIFCGLSINGAIIGSIVSLVSDSNIEQTKHYRNIETLREYLTRKQVPNDLIQSNIGFLQYLATENGMLTMLRDEVFSSLPHSIKISIDQEMKTLPYLRQCPFFDFFPDELLRGISARLRTRMYCKNDKIINYGDLGHEMFFLEKGKVDIVSADGRTVFATLEEGSFFGETAIFFKVTRAATVRAASPFCVCLVLAKEDLNQELRSLEFDEIEILNIFKRLQVSNQRRNAAIEMNLKYSLVQTHKLSKLIKRAGGDDTSSSTAFRIRKILTPESLFRVLWDFAGLVFLIYFTFSIPMYIAFFFGSDVELYTKRVIYEVFISFYWLLDMVLKLKYFSYYSDLVSQKLVTDPDLIWLHYFNTLEFKLDLLASIPFELLILSPNMSYTTVFMIRAIHLLKIPQIPVYISLFENHVRRLLAIHIGRTTSLIVKAGLAYIVLSHWLACGFFMIHRYAEINHDVTYVIADKLADYHPVTGRHNICNTAIRYCYARSMYFVIGTMTSVGYGDISPYTNDEIMFEQAVAILGAYIAAIFLGYCGTFQADQDSSGHRGFVKGLAKLEAFVKYRRLPGYLHSAIITQYTYIYKKTNSLDGDNNLLLQKLSEPSQMELSLYMNEEIMNSVPIFSEAAAPLRRRLAARLRPQFVLENGNIYRAGDVGRTVFFVYSGRVQVTLSADRKALDAFGVASLRLLLHKQTHHGPVYEKGDHFGELCLLSSAGLRADTAQALSGCEMYYLVKEELWDEFTYIEPKMRREFIHDLFSRVGKTKHCHSKVDKTHQDDTSDTRITSLFRMAFGIMEDIYDELDGEDQDDSSVHDELNDSPDTAENPQESTVEDFDHFVDQSTLISPNDGSPTIARRSALVRKAGSGNFEEDLAVESVPGSRKHSSAGGVNETPHSTSTVLRKSNKSSDQEDLAALIKQDSEVRSDRRFSDMHKHRVFLHRKRSVFSAVAIMTKHKLQILQDEQNNPQKFQLTLDKLCDGELIDSTKALSDEKNDDERTVPIAPICTPHPLTHLTHLSPDVGRRKHAPLRISNASSKLPTLRERVDTSSSHSPPQDNFSSDSPVSPGLSKKDVLAIATKKFKQMAQKGSDPKFSAPEGNGHDDVETFLCDLEDDNNAFRPKERHQSHMEISDMDD